MKYLRNDKTSDNTKLLKVINSIIKHIETNVAESMYALIGSKPTGLIFDYLDSELFKNLKIMDERLLDEDQLYSLHRARCQYNSRLKYIAKSVGIEKPKSHVSRH